MPSDTNVLKFIRKCLPFARRRLHPGSAPALTTHATSTPPLAAEVIAAFRSSAEPDGEGDTRQVKWTSPSMASPSSSGGRPLAHLVKELLQNALDATDDKGVIDLWIAAGEQRVVSVLCSEDGLGADVETVNVMSLTGKKDSVLQRGRMGRGFKEVLSVSSFALVKSRGQQLVFDHDEHGPTIRRRSWSGHKRGFHALFDISHGGGIGEALGYLRTIMPSYGMKLSINGQLVATQPAVRHRREAGNGDVPGRRLAKAPERVRNPSGRSRTGRGPVDPRDGYPGLPGGVAERYHCDVLQRVPMNLNRDAVVAGYAGKLRTACFPTLLKEFDRDRALAPWPGKPRRTCPTRCETAVTRSFGIWSGSLMEKRWCGAPLLTAAMTSMRRPRRCDTRSCRSTARTST